jgi:predicted component of type VI protein secretion system
MSVFKIKLEDKAAFLNRMEKAGVELNTNQMVDNKLEGYFEVTIDEPKQLEVATSILKQSPKINTIKEMENKKKMTKDELKEMVRQELQAVLAEKKKADEDKDKLDEATLEESPAAEILSILAGVAGLGLGSAAILKAQDMLKAKKPELFKKLQAISGTISAADPSKNI